MKSSAGRAEVASEDALRWSEDAGSKSWVALPIASSGRFSATNWEFAEVEYAACWAGAANPVKATADQTNRARTRERALACVAVAVLEVNTIALIVVSIGALHYFGDPSMP